MIISVTKMQSILISDIFSSIRVTVLSISVFTAFSTALLDIEIEEKILANSSWVYRSPKLWYILFLLMEKQRDRGWSALSLEWRTSNTIEMLHIPTLALNNLFVDRTISFFSIHNKFFDIISFHS